MFNVGAGEMVFILVAALLILGPKRLPEMARGIGKALRDFRRQTEDVRHVVEREFYAMDQEVIPPTDMAPKLTAPEGTLAAGGFHGAGDAHADSVVGAAPALTAETGSEPPPGSIPSRPPTAARTYSSPELAFSGRALEPSLGSSREVEPSRSILPDDAGSHGKAD